MNSHRFFRFLRSLLSTSDPGDRRGQLGRWGRWGRYGRYGRSATLAMAALLALVVSPAVQAQAVCVPQASGVPALAGAPEFLNTGLGEPRYWPRLDDPRWRGALAQGFGSGASEAVSFRVLRVGAPSPALYLSWYVKVDSRLDPFLDSLRVAFAGDGMASRMVEVFPFTNSLSNVTAVPPPLSNVFERAVDQNGGGWAPVNPKPGWVDANTRVWLDSANQQWAINMRVPISPAGNDGLKLPDSFRMAFEVAVSQADNSIVPYRFSNAVSLNDLNAVPMSTTWTAMNIANSPAPGTCAKAISLAVSDVGTTNVDAMMVSRPNRINLNGVNTFFALPNNETLNAVAANNISATFRIANWGSQPDWNDISMAGGTLWKQLNSSAVTNAGVIAGGTKASLAGGNALSFNWTPTAAERCEFIGKGGIPAGQSPTGVAIPGDMSCPNAAPTRRLHQCMLVELSGGGLSFNPASVYRNMDFVDASTFTRDAEISVAGLPAGGGSHRDVYLYVQKLQMPASVKSPVPQTLVDYQKVQALPTHDGPIVQPSVLRRATLAATPSATAASAPRPALNGSFDTLNQQFPTYIVHAYRDTGATRVVNGKTLKVLRPQSSFGYYVTHEGALTGWDTALEGAEEIAPNFYRVSVIQGGAATVKTRIVARETDQPGPVPGTGNSPYAAWIAGGIAIPHGKFADTQRTGPAVALGLEMALSSDVSLEGTLSWHRLDGKTGQPDVDVTQLGLNGKWMFSPQGMPMRPFATLGAGLYSFDPGKTRLGFNLGLGAQWQIAPQWSLEGRYQLHAVTSNSPQSVHSTLLLGLRYAY